MSFMLDRNMRILIVSFSVAVFSPSSNASECRSVRDSDTLSTLSKLGCHVEGRLQIAYDPASPGFHCARGLCTQFFVNGKIVAPDEAGESRNILSIIATYPASARLPKGSRVDLLPVFNSEFGNFDFISSKIDAQPIRFTISFWLDADHDAKTLGELRQVAKANGVFEFGIRSN